MEVNFFIIFHGYGLITILKYLDWLCKGKSELIYQFHCTSTVLAGDSFCCVFAAKVATSSVLFYDAGWAKQEAIWSLPFQKVSSVKFRNGEYPVRINCHLQRQEQSSPG